jgi:hypothetical protein
MSSSDQEGKPAAAALDAERERLRKAGYTDAEVSQILIARAASQQPAAAAGQGVMSGALSSVVAVGSHARSVIPSFRTDVATIFDGAATASARAGATASLVVKAVVILVLGYAAWQEWNQHIIYSTEIARQQVRKTTAEADTAEIERDAKGGRPTPFPGSGCTVDDVYLKEAAKAEREGRPVPPSPCRARTTLEVQEEVAKKTRLEACARLGVQPDKCPDF